MAAVGIDNDFAAGQAGVSMRAADNELAGGIDMQNEVIVEQCGDFGKQMLFYARQKNFFDVLFDAVKHECICVILSKPVFPA